MYSFNSEVELREFLKSNIINSKEATQLLNCSRQNIDDLVRRNKLIPIRVFPRDRLFLKQDILNRLK